MDTKAIYAANGHVAVFEIEKILISVKQISHLIRSVDGVSNVYVRKPFSMRSDIHVEFTYMENIFVVYEPFGESNVYWVGPKESAGEHVDLKAIEIKFKDYQPLFIRNLLGFKISSWLFPTVQ